MSENQVSAQSGENDSDPAADMSPPATDEASGFSSPESAPEAGSIIISNDDRSSAPRARPSDDTVVRRRHPYGASSRRDTDTVPHDEIAKQLVGTMLGHYSLEELIGGGGMGVVFRGVDTRLNRIVAVKVLTYRDGKVEEIVRRFQLEAQSAAQLAHENIAQVYDVGEDNGWNYIAFEYIDGQNIRDLVVDEGPLPVATAISYAIQTAEALSHACDREVVHRDVKPSNLIVTPEGHVKLVDMGLARVHQVESHEEDLTESGMTLGTFDYISPEQGQDPRSADIRSDLYSLGCTLYFMLTGRAPFPHGTALQKLLHHVSETPPDPRAYRNDLPDELVGVLNKLLAKKPNQRYQHPSALIAMLQSIADREGIVVHSSLSRTPDRVPATAQTAMLQQLPWLVPLVLLFAAAFAIGGFPWTANSYDSIPPFTPPAGSTGPLAVAEQTTPLVSRDAVTDETSPPLIPPPVPSRETADSRNDSGDVETQKPAIARELQPRRLSDGSRRAVGNDIPRSLDIPASEEDEITSLIVLDESDLGRPFSPPRDTHVAPSLDEALRLSTRLPNLREIELRTHAPIYVQPTTFVQRNLTIRAAEDYAPVIRIQATSATEVTNVFSLIGGALRLQGLFIIVDINGSPGQLASLFQLEEAAQLSLRQCWIRIENESDGSRGDDSFSVFDVIAPEYMAPGMNEPAIQLADCVIHGDTTVVRSNEATPFLFDWSNGFLATSDRLLSVGGTLIPVDADRQITLQLDHLTAVVDKGLMRLEATPEAAELITIDAACTNCIFIGSPNYPLVEHVVFNLSVDRLEDFFHFRGRRNFYEDVVVFWQQIVRDGLDPQQQSQQDLTFYDWRDHWKDESSPRWDAVQWQHRPLGDGRRHTLVPDDFALSRLPGNPARLLIGGMDRADAGTNLAALPRPAQLIGVAAEQD